MSYSDYRMNLIIAAHGEQLRADLQRNVGALTQFERQLTNSGRKLGLWGQQMKAIGTTIRYSLAGAAVYGVASAISNLGEFENQLGSIDSLAARIGRDGNLQGLGGQLDKVGDFALETSSKFGIAVPDIEQYMQRFYSSFDAPAGERGIQQMRAFTGEIAQLQVALGTEVGDPATLASSIAGFIRAMGPRAMANIPRSTRRLTNIISETTRLSPQLGGAELATGIGRLASGLTTARLSPEQAFSILGTASQAGGSANVIIRGVTQMLSAGLVPSHMQKRQIAAFQQVGLPTDPNALREIGGWEILRRMLRAVVTGPISARNRGALTSEAIDDPGTAVDAAGISGINIALAGNLFGRQESFRQFINLLAVGGPRALDKFIGSVNEGERTNRVAQRADLANQRRYFQRLQETQRNIGIEFMRGFAPVFSRFARVEAGVGHLAMSVGPTGLVAGAGGIAAASLASRLIFSESLTGLAGRGLGRLGAGRALGRLGLGRLLGRSSELAAASLVGAGPSALSATGLQGAGSRANPFWVVIDPLSWFMPGAPSDKSSGTRTGPNGPGGSRARDLLRRVVPIFNPRNLTRAGGAAGLAATLEATTLLATPGADTGAGSLGGIFRRIHGRHGFPVLDRTLRQVLTHQHTPFSDETLRAAFGAAGSFGDHPGRAEGILERAIRQRNFEQRNRGGMLGGLLNAVQQVVGEASVTVQLAPTSALKQAIAGSDAKVHVPVKLWPVATTGGNRPTTKGKTKSARTSATGSN